MIAYNDDTSISVSISSIHSRSGTAEILTHGIYKT